MFRGVTGEVYISAVEVRHPVLWKRHSSSGSLETSESSEVGSSIPVARDSGFCWVLSCSPQLLMSEALALAPPWPENPSGGCCARNLPTPHLST